MLPMLVFLLFMGGVWWALSLLSSRTTQAEQRLDRIGRQRQAS
jgi:tight adherence protein C